MRRALSARSTFLLLVLFASACASSVETGSTGSTGSPTSSGTRSAPPPSSVSPGGPAAVPEILDFRAPLVGGGTFDAAELAGTPVAIWFWAPW
ncbi:MAG: hypothetical protein L0206_05520 [Actinobacteria bacterium]|nr:hypothetical protein [Actinomycetota bacterium]